MNNLQNMKKYQSNSETGLENDGFRYDDKKNLQNDNDEEFIDLSNIQNITDLNQLSAIEKKQIGAGDSEDENEVNVDNIEVDLDDDEIEQMERMIRTNMQRNSADDHFDENNFGVETPESNMSDQENNEQFFANGGKPQQIRNELRQLLAQSSSEQLDIINDENTNLNQLTESEERELRRKWLQDGLFAEDMPQQESAEKQNKSIELGEQPIGNDRLKTEDFQDARENSNSPPLVTSKASSANNSKPVSKKGSAEELEKMPSLIENKAEKPPLPSRDLSEMKAVDAKEKTSKAKDPEKAIDQSAADGDENDSFHRLYNKEIKVNQDEIPLLLLELTDIAYKFIKKEQFEKAYVLLQKTESVLEVVNLEHSKRDRYFAYITYLNMAMCFQKLGMLEECIIYLKETIQVIEKPSFFKDVSISQRMKQMHMQCQLKLQLCAILSQTQKHAEAMENAKASVRLAHQILRDMYDLCVFYSNKIKFKDDFASLSLLLMDETDEEQLLAANKSKQAYGDSTNAEKEKAVPKHTKSEINEKMFQKQFIRENSPVRDIPFNILEESISMIERTALKLLPIMKELGNRLAGTNKSKGIQAFHTMAAGVDGSVDTRNLSEQKSTLMEHLKSKQAQSKKDNIHEESESLQEDSELKDPAEAAKKSEKKDDQVDMRTILGFLNQNEWILNLNIGNIMQIQPCRMRDFLQFHRNEHQLSRESFLEKLQLLVVSYFCVSTELRFIIQSRSGFMKADSKKEKELEQEYWHVKALDIACAFLPSECPLFNHILLSYQKHHDPTMIPIEEDKEQDDVLTVLRPLKGIENSKYQPIIRQVENVYIDIAEIPLSPLSKCFDQRLLPKKVKTSTTDVQTEKIEEPKPPLMKSISIQNDLKITEPDEKKKKEEEPAQKVYQDSETITDNNQQQAFAYSNAYLDINSSKYQEDLMEKIINDPAISDKQQFLSKLITRVQSQEPEKFQLSNQPKGMTNYNTASQNLDNIAYFQNHYNSTEAKNLKQNTIQDQEIYGHHGHHQKKKPHMSSKGGKNTQSGQLNYKQKRHGQNFDDLQQYSFDMKSQFGKNHVRSMYGGATADGNQSDGTAIGVGMKHHIASQSLAPSQTVFTEKHSKKAGASKTNQMISHKKNQSISGLMKSDDMFKNTAAKTKQTMDHSSVNKQFNSSVNSNFSSKHQYGAKKKQTKSNDKREQARLAQTKTKTSQNINLSNQKLQKSTKPSKYLQNNMTEHRKSMEKSGAQQKYLHQTQKQNKSYQSTHGQKVPLSKNEDSLMNELGDVMSSSYSGSASPSSAADPDLHGQMPSQPESSMSDMNKTHTNQSIQSMHADENISEIFRTQEERDRYMAAKSKYATNAEHQHRLKAGQPHSSQTEKNNKKQRPSSSSAITNYTSGQSALRNKLAKQRVNNLQQQMGQNNQSRGQIQKTKVQQQQNLLKNMKQSKQKYADSGAPLVPKKKSKVLSRKKYGSDKSSNSPPQNIGQSGGGQHGYSIAQGPFSIFDSGNSHTISKFSNIQQSKQSIPADQSYQVYNERSLSKKKKSTHVNSQTIQIENKNQKPQKYKKESSVQNQSENILSRLQNLLVKKDDDKLNQYENTKMLDKKSKNTASAKQYASHGQYSGKYGQANLSNPRKSANSIGSLGYSHSNQTRQSRYSANSKGTHSRKSRISRSKSKSKSSKSGRGKSASNERQQQMNISNQEGFNSSTPNVNQSQIVQSQHYLDSDGEPFDKKQQRSFNLMHEMRPQHQMSQPDPKRQKARKNALRQRPKSSMMFEGQRESIAGSKKAKNSAARQLGGHKKSTNVQKQNHSIENLQRQVLENQKILLNNAHFQSKSSNKTSKRNAPFHTRHNHNNSISLMGGQMHNQSLFQNQNQAFQTNMSSSGPISGTSASGLSKKKQNRKSTGKQNQVMNNLQNGLQNIQNKNLSLKMTQQHLSNNLKSFANIMNNGGGISTTASTNGAAQQFQSNKTMKSRKQNNHKRKGSAHNGQAQREFINFEQMQQQLEGGVTLGGAEIQLAADGGFVQHQMDIEQIQDGSNMGFVPHKNLMPKTTGSQAHLLNIQQQQQQEAASSVGHNLGHSQIMGQTQKSLNSLNQTGRTANSIGNRQVAQSHHVGGRKIQPQK